MKALVVMGKRPAKIIVHDDSKIVRDMDTLTIHNKPMDKSYKKVFNKRIMGEGFDTYPHGYLKPADEG